MEGSAGTTTSGKKLVGAVDQLLSGAEYQDLTRRVSRRSIRRRRRLPLCVHVCMCDRCAAQQLSCVFIYCLAVDYILLQMKAVHAANQKTRAKDPKEATESP